VSRPRGLAGVASSPALAFPPETLVAHIPFAFNVRNETLPPGDYRITTISDLDRQVLEIRSKDGRHAVITFSEDAPAARSTTTPTLVFDRYGHMSFLHAIRLPEETGAVFEPSRSEIQAARGVTSEQATHGSGGKTTP
jgi:hypothetical protein